MANEVEIHELADLIGDRPVARMPAIEKQTINIGALSAAFNRSTVMVRITTTTTCRLEFGTAPNGSGDTILCYSGMFNDYEVIAGHKVYAAAA